MNTRLKNNFVNALFFSFIDHFETLFFICLIFYHINYLSPRQFYLNYNYFGKFSFTLFILSLILIQLTKVAINKIKEPYKIFCNTYFYLILIPSLALSCSLLISNNIYFIFITCIPLITFFIINFFQSIIGNKPNNIIEFYNLKNITNVLLIFCTLLTLGIFIYNFSVLNLDILKVYDFRELQSNNLPLFFRYSTTTLLSSLLPFLFLFYLNERAYLNLIILSTLFLIIFASTSNRISLFEPIILIVFHFTYLKKSKNFLIIICLLLISSLIFLEFTRTFIFYFTDGLFRRFLFDPSFTNYIYIDFFQNHPHYNFGDTVISKSEIYDLSFTKLLGIMQTGNIKTNLSTGLIGSGYARFGIIGIFIYSIILYSIFYFFQFMKIPNKICSFLLFYPILILATSSDITTLFITHGFLFIILLCFFINKNV